MSKTLQTERNTIAVEAKVRQMAESTIDGHEILTYFEHGQWWVTCPCGAIWSVVDAEPGIDGTGLDVEEIESGEEDFHE